MTPDRWREIEKLYHAARESGPGVLAETDPELRREVEKLLAQDSSGKILDRPATDLLDEFAATQKLPDGESISHYKILERIGAGGMGVVYKALDTRLGRTVALKFLPPHLSHDTALRMRLTDEARAASALDHPNIVVIHDIDQTPAGDLFIAMAFHGAETLRDRIHDGLSVADSLQIARQIASGLARAHEHGIVHRDIKPSNVVVTQDGTARIIDFGLAKSSEVTATETGSAKGTPLYMSPEQASGKSVDFRTDIWSLGTVLYEMLAGKPPFAGDSQLQVMHAVIHNDPPKLRELRPDLPAEVYPVVERALQKDPAKRYASAQAMGNDLSAALAALESPAASPAGVRRIYLISAAILIVLAIVAAIWLYRRSENRHWAREQAIPEIGKLLRDHKSVAAFLLLKKAEQYIPGDGGLTQAAAGVRHTASIRSSPAGATVQVQDYVSPDGPWLALGVTPLVNITVPTGYLRWKISKPGVGEYISAPIVEDIHGLVNEFNFPLDAVVAAPKGMVPIPAGKYAAMIWSLPFIGPYDLPLSYIDQFEVTNRQFQDFVDQGGYQKREYWKEKFYRDTRELSWEQAMDLFRDSSGRPGPAGWDAGHYPAGQDDYPVGGVSWYEAAAFAEFAGKKLPTVLQWFSAAPSGVARPILSLSNFSAFLAPVGKYKGVGPFGTYDMAGNMAEWASNESDGHTRFNLGGAWNTATNEYFEPGILPPMNRGGNSGFRCVKNTAPMPAETTAELHQMIRDFAKTKPVSDERFRDFVSMYAYDRTPLHDTPEPVPQDSPDWHKEKITIDAAYNGERMALYLFLPNKVKAPYQTVVFFPSARVLDIPDSKTLGNMNFIDFVIKSGRAVLYPVFKGTYERPAEPPGPDTVAGRDVLIKDSKDLGRSIDYLATRKDIDMSKLGYMGVSMGAALGLNMVALEPRIRTFIMLDGGFYFETPLPGTDQVDFAPRLKVPTLLVAGKFDWIFSGKSAMLDALGTPKANKKAVFLETAHDVGEQRADLIREVVAWLDKYFGKVN